MMRCEFVRTAGHWRCSHCGSRVRVLESTVNVPPIGICRALYKQFLPKGPGDYLHDAILKWVGEGPTRECGCKDRIAKMNAWGPAGCREHLEEIVEWLMNEAQKRKWGKLLTRIPGNDYLIRWMVKVAILAAENETIEIPASDS
jgi:hypothetical protein